MDIFSLWKNVAHIGKLCLMNVISSNLGYLESFHFALIGCFTFPLGIESFLMYSVHEGIRGIPLDPNDKMDALMPISGASFAVGIDFHAGKYYEEFVVCMVKTVNSSRKLINPLFSLQVITTAFKGMGNGSC